MGNTTDKQTAPKPKSMRPPTTQREAERVLEEWEGELLQDQVQEGRQAVSRALHIRQDQLKAFSQGREFNIDTVTNEVAFHFEQGIRHYLEIGRLLVWAREEMDYGEWGIWLETNFELNRRTAYRYMNAAIIATLYPNVLIASKRSITKLLTIGRLPHEDLRR